MPYSAQISRTNPACILLLIDQSRSMEEPFATRAGDDTTGVPSKAAAVADAVNRLIQNLVLRSAKADGVRDYFRVGVIGYGKNVKACLGGKLPFDCMLPISRLSDKPLRVETHSAIVPDDSGDLVEQTSKYPVWYDAEANGPTPMSEAMAAAALAVTGFIGAFPNAYPPIVLNITDGKPTDADPQPNARTLRGLKTTDGKALLFNLLISSDPTLPVYFLSDDSLITDTYSKLLFRMSSKLPPQMWQAARAEGIDVAPEARGVVFNAVPTAVVRFLDIGTRVTPGPR